LSVANIKFSNDPKCSEKPLKKNTKLLIRQMTKVQVFTTLSYGNKKQSMLAGVERQKEVPVVKTIPAAAGSRFYFFSVQSHQQ
jgi:hypothetical protein